MIGRTNTGGGGSGGTLTVTAPVGVTATVSKDGKTKTKKTNATGLAVFKGLATGTWTLTITNGVETATKTIEITADYTTSITFFVATIGVSYPAGSICTVSDGVTTFTAPDTSGVFTCLVPNAGTWTVTITNGTKTRSDKVTITTNGQNVPVTMAYTVYLFNNGKIDSALTGGFSGSGYILNGVAVNPGGIDSSGELLYAQSKSTTQGGMGTVNKVDLTGYSKLSALGTTTLSGGFSKIWVCASKNVDASVVAAVDIAENAVVSIDISGLSGSYYIIFGADASQSNTTSYVRYFKLEV